MRILIISFAALLAACTSSTTTEVAAPETDTKLPAASLPTAAASQPVAVSPKGGSPDTREQMDDDGIVRRGVELTATAALSVGDCTSKAAELNGKTVKVNGTVDKVCAKKGCWFVIADGEQNIRITMKDYGFFVPSSSVGMQATIEGELEVKEMSEEEAKHMAEDGGKDPSTVTGPQKEVRLIATAVQMQSAS